MQPKGESIQTESKVSKLNGQCKRRRQSESARVKPNQDDVLEIGRHTQAGNDLALDDTPKSPSSCLPRSENFAKRRKLSQIYEPSGNPVKYQCVESHASISNSQPANSKNKRHFLNVSKAVAEVSPTRRKQVTCTVPQNEPARQKPAASTVPQNDRIEATPKDQPIDEQGAGKQKQNASTGRAELDASRARINRKRASQNLRNNITQPNSVPIGGRADDSSDASIAPTSSRRQSSLRKTKLGKRKKRATIPIDDNNHTHCNTGQSHLPKDETCATRSDQPLPSKENSRNFTSHDSKHVCKKRKSNPIASKKSGHHFDELVRRRELDDYIASSESARKPFLGTTESTLKIKSLAKRRDKVKSGRRDVINSDSKDEFAAGVSPNFENGSHDGRGVDISDGRISQMEDHLSHGLVSRNRPKHDKLNAKPSSEILLPDDNNMAIRPRGSQKHGTGNKREVSKCTEKASLENGTQEESKDNYSVRDTTDDSEEKSETVQLRKEVVNLYKVNGTGTGKLVSTRSRSPSRVEKEGESVSGKNAIVLSSDKELNMTAGEQRANALVHDRCAPNDGGNKDSNGMSSTGVKMNIAEHDQIVRRVSKYKESGHGVWKNTSNIIDFEQVGTSGLKSAKKRNDDEDVGQGDKLERTGQYSTWSGGSSRIKSCKDEIESKLAVANGIPASENGNETSENDLIELVNYPKSNKAVLHNMRSELTVSLNEHVDPDDDIEASHHKKELCPPKSIALISSTDKQNKTVGMPYTPANEESEAVHRNGVDNCDKKRVSGKGSKSIFESVKSTKGNESPNLEQVGKSKFIWNSVRICTAEKSKNDSVNEVQEDTTKVDVVQDSKKRMKKKAPKSDKKSRKSQKLKKERGDAKEMLKSREKKRTPRLKKEYSVKCETTNGSIINLDAEAGATGQNERLPRGLGSERSTPLNKVINQRNGSVRSKCLVPILALAGREGGGHKLEHKKGLADLAEESDDEPETKVSPSMTPIRTNRSSRCKKFAVTSVIDLTTEEDAKADEGKAEDAAFEEVVTKMGDFGISSTMIDLKKTKFGKFVEPLSKEETMIVDKLVRSESDEKVVTVFGAGITLRGSDIKRLRGTRWLNDEIINAYVYLINARNKEIFSKSDVSKGIPRTVVFNTFFYTRLTATSSGYDYAGVRRWTHRAKVDVLNYDLILVPVNLGNHHWILGGIDMEREKFLFLDSMSGTDEVGVTDCLRRWLFDELRDKHGAEVAKRKKVFDWNKMENEYIVRRTGVLPESLESKSALAGRRAMVPQQTDGGSCGVFMSKIADCLSLGLKVYFMQPDILLIRQRMVLDLIRESVPM